MERRRTGVRLEGRDCEKHLAALRVGAIFAHADGRIWHRNLPARALVPWEALPRELLRAGEFVLDEARGYISPVEGGDWAVTLWPNVLRESDVRRILEKKWGCSEQQVRIVLAKRNALPLKLAAEVCGMRYKTADKHLQRAYEKCEVGSQAELEKKIREALEAGE